MNVIISGICGNMGEKVYDAVRKRGHLVVCGIDKSLSGNFDCPVYRNFDEINDVADCVIDFSSPSNLNRLLEYATLNKTPLVIGTTGFTEEDKRAIKKASEIIPVFMTSNTSVGINLLIELCKVLAENLKGYDVEIIETHHKNKKDAPSGTTYSIVEGIKSVRNLQDVYGRKGAKKRSESEIGIHSVRGGSVVGEHEVIFFGENDCISVKHTAYSKALFAEGAVDACEFVTSMPAGFYGMDELRSR